MRILILLLVLAWTPLFATDFSWVAPTEYEDGTPLTVADLDFYQLICSGQSFQYPGTATSSSETFAPGDYTCALTVAAINGQVSAPSNVVNFSIAQPIPKAPTGLTVTP